MRTLYQIMQQLCDVAERMGDITSMHMHAASAYMGDTVDISGTTDDNRKFYLTLEIKEDKDDGAEEE